ncbi:hypothetical protein PCC8801_0576 [Rippkaea orientalis PCC 8801]|uniref:Uncharacterized protein n=1 Tax=Rippkaea orientalis (strain PCC 8801 / RF-1) TaxID=41431 RepID=B7JVU4_RIPO1|nr:type IV pilin-like G/H family protein [Rippkaea orientalis]ACK64665.1 hypothetical protein PCC8801_0576 [Rippkaea orientalis PCC 8801]
MKRKDESSQTNSAKELPIWQMLLLIFLRYIIGGIVGLFGLMFVLLMVVGFGPPGEQRNHRPHPKILLGAINRAQQGYYTEHKQFASTWDDLGIRRPSTKDFEYHFFAILDGKLTGVVIAKGIDNKKIESRDYIAGVNYNRKYKIFNTIVCRASDQLKSQNYQITNPEQAISNYGVVDQSTMICGEGLMEIK